VKIVDIYLLGNEHGQRDPNVIYAKLVDDDGGLLIAATLDYILTAIRDRNLKVDGVNVSRVRDFWGETSKVTLESCSGRSQFGKEIE